jgi:hypothetical protein
LESLRNSEFKDRNPGCPAFKTKALDAEIASRALKRWREPIRT